MKLGDVMLREYEDGELELGIIMDYAGYPVIETADFYYAFWLHRWIYIGEL